MNKSKLSALAGELLAAVPAEAQALVGRFENQLGQIEATRDSQIQDIEAEAEGRKQQAQAKCENDRKQALVLAMEALDAIKARCIASGDMDAALAIVAQQKLLSQTEKPKVVDAKPDPGSLSDFDKVGQVCHFKIRGDKDGTVWGSGPYTGDSDLSTAAVHAGVIEDGQTDVILVKIVNMRGQTVRGSRANGVETRDWGSYDIGFVFE